MPKFLNNLEPIILEQTLLVLREPYKTYVVFPFTDQSRMRVDGHAASTSAISKVIHPGTWGIVGLRAITTRKDNSPTTDEKGIDNIHALKFISGGEGLIHSTSG